MSMNEDEGEGTFALNCLLLDTILVSYNDGRKSEPSLGSFPELETWVSIQWIELAHFHLEDELGCRF
jgi:hypothetical protein